MERIPKTMIGAQQAAFADTINVIRVAMVVVEIRFIASKFSPDLRIIRYMKM